MIEKFLARIFNAIPSWIAYLVSALLSFGLSIYTFKTSGTSQSMVIILLATFGFWSSVAALRHYWHRNDKPDEDAYGQ